MNIAFLASQLLPIHAQILDEQPIGGTETGVVRLAAALHKLGHSVTVFTTHPSPPPSLPQYRSLHTLSAADQFDVMIGTRDWIPLVQNLPTRLKMLWTGDSYDIFQNYGIGDRRIARQIDSLLTVSQWQAHALSTTSSFPIEKTFVLGNGIEASLFDGHEVRNAKRLIYSSTPHRGLKHIPSLFLELKKKHPSLEIHIFSGYEVYGQSGVGAYEKLKKELEAMPDTFFRGNIHQSQLAREFMKSSILFYPCDYEETFCITALEAQAAGCVVITSRHSALPETVGDAGILIPGRPDSPEYQSAFIKAADQVLSRPEIFDTLSRRGKERAKTQTWNDIARKFEQHLQSFEIRRPS